MKHRGLTEQLHYLENSASGTDYSKSPRHSNALSPSGSAFLIARQIDGHPKSIIVQFRAHPDQCYFGASHAEAELDPLVADGGSLRVRVPKIAARSGSVVSFR